MILSKFLCSVTLFLSEEVCLQFPTSPSLIRFASARLKFSDSFVQQQLSSQHALRGEEYRDGHFLKQD